MGPADTPYDATVTFRGKGKFTLTRADKKGPPLVFTRATD
jgi:hypothetical protein